MKPPIEKRLRSQHELVHFQAAIIVDRVRGLERRSTEEDLRTLLRGLDNFRETLVDYKALVKEAGA